MQRVKIDSDKKEVIVNFNPKIYPQGSIMKAIEDFSEACEVYEKDGNIVLSPKEEDIELETLGYEFYNYVLGLIKNGY